MIQLLSLLFLLQIATSCMNIHSACDVLKPGEPDGRTGYAAMRTEGYELEFDRLLTNGDINAGFIEKNNIDVKKPLYFDQGQGRAPHRYHYPIERAISGKAPIASLEFLLDNGTPIDGFADYNLVKGILRGVVRDCGTVSKQYYEHENTTSQDKTEWHQLADKNLLLYQKYLKMLFSRNINLENNFPEHNGHIGFEGRPELPYETCKPIDYLSNALESKKKDQSLVVFDKPFDTIQNVLKEEITRRQQTSPNQHRPKIPVKNSQSIWQSTVLKTALGVGAFTALFFATKWLYPKFAGTEHLPKLKGE